MINSRFISRYLRLFLFFTAIAITLRTSAQESDFHLIYLSNEIDVSAQSLQIEIKASKSMEAVKQLVGRRLENKSGWIIILYRKGNGLYRWSKLFGRSSKEEERKWEYYGRRGPGSIKIADRFGFSEVLRDTVVVFDTLRMSVLFNTEKFPVRQYEIRIIGDSDLRTVRVPVINYNEILFTATELSSLNASYSSVELYNAKKEEDLLARFVLFLPSQKMTEQWKSIADTLKTVLPSLSQGEIAIMMSSFIRENYGFCGEEQIVDWLNRQ